MADGVTVKRYIFTADGVTVKRYIHGERVTVKRNIFTADGATVKRYIFTADGVAVKGYIFTADGVTVKRYIFTADGVTVKRYIHGERVTVKRYIFTADGVTVIWHRRQSSESPDTGVLSSTHSGPRCFTSPLMKHNLHLVSIEHKLRHIKFHKVNVFERLLKKVSGKWEATEVLALVYIVYADRGVPFFRCQVAVAWAVRPSIT